MTLEMFLTLLLMVSVITGLAVEAIKMVLDDLERSYAANTLAGGVSALLSLAIGAAYVIMTGAALNAKLAVVLIALMFLSWLSAMVGYDKVVQAIKQIRSAYSTMLDNGSTEEKEE